MSPELQLICLALSLVSLYSILNMIRKYKLDLKYSLLWLFLCVTLVIMSVWPGILSTFSNLLSIEAPVNALFFLGIMLSLLILFSLTVALSRSSVKIKYLSQEIGLLKSDLEKYLKREEK